MRKKMICGVAVLLCALLLVVWHSRRADRTVSFEQYDFGTVQKAMLKSAHTGEWIWIEDEASLDAITAFLWTVKGKQRESAKGYYEGTYTLELYDENQRMTYAIGFGDQPTFYFGENETDPEYPNRYLLDGKDIDEVTGFFEAWLPLDRPA